MLLLIYIDTISCAEASFHPIPAAVTKGVQPDPKLNHNDNVYQHTQTHKYNKRCAMQAAMLPSAAAPLSTINAPPLDVPTPWLIINLKLNRLHSCINPARTCAAAAAVTQDCARLRALLQRKKVRNVPTQKLRRPPPNCRDDRRHHHSTARCGARSCGAPMPQQLSIELQHRADAMRIEFGVKWAHRPSGSSPGRCVSPQRLGGAGAPSRSGHTSGMCVLPGRLPTVEPPS